MRRYPDGQVLKLCDPRDDDPSTSLGDLVRYVESLRGAGIRLPEDLAVVDCGGTLGVRHNWVTGPVLTEVAASDPDRFVTGVYRIAEWTEILTTGDARLDTNLANFVIPADAQLTCVDVLPTLLTPPRHTTPDGGDWRRLYDALCFDPDISLCALASSALRVLLAVHGREHASRYLRELESLCPGHDNPEALPAWWFHTRLQVATRAAAGRIPLAVANMCSPP
jgi:hypothetical protein